MRKDRIRVVVHLVVFLVAYYGIDLVFDPLFRWVGGEFAGPITGVLFAVVFASWLVLRIYEDRALPDLGLWWNRASTHNLLLGLLGGAGAALLVLVPPLIVGTARITWTHAPIVGAMVFGSVFLAAGVLGEELFFRGYAFQLLVANLGPFATVLPIGVIFGLMHLGNPNATWFGAANTAGFGILFGYAYLRSRDLWLPIGLHFGWNFTFPFFGAYLSGIKIMNEVMGHQMVWKAGDLWSGGEYGPEASVLTSAVLVAAFVYVAKAPVRRQSSPLTDPPESALCEPSPPLPS